MFLAYYLKTGMKMEYLLNVDFYTKQTMIGCMLGQYELELKDNIALNPFIKKE